MTFELNKKNKSITSHRIQWVRNSALSFWLELLFLFWQGKVSFSCKNPCAMEAAVVYLTFMLLVANFANSKWCEKPENDWNPSKWVLMWEYSVRAIQWIPTWKGLGFQKYLGPDAWDESSCSIGMVKWLYPSFLCVQYFLSSILIYHITLFYMLSIILMYTVNSQ